jgi:hypothetical protein
VAALVRQETGRRIVSDQEMHIHLRRLVDPKRKHGIEIGLHHAAPIDCDPLPQCRTDTVECCALHLILRIDGIDGLATDVAGDPDFVNLHAPRWRDIRLHNLRGCPALITCKTSAR